MTTSRIVRGTKARIFLYVSAVLIITGVIACYNNTLSQLENVKKASEICLQQEENLSTQLQVISDYKQRLEKSLKTEKAEHQHVKNELENKFNEEKSKNEKLLSETNVRFTTLQQHFNLLQTEHDDLKGKLREIEDELREVKVSKENLKSKYLELQTKIEVLQNEKEDLQKQVTENVKVSNDGQSKINHLTKQNHELVKELDQLKEKCAVFEAIQPPNVLPNTSPPTNLTKQLDTQIKPEEGVVPEPRNVAIPMPPNQNFIKTPTKSTTSSSLKVSQGSLNGARPLLLPTVTPKGKLTSMEHVKKLPEGVVPVPPVPAKRDVEKKTEEEHNELPEETINNRYRNKIGDTDTVVKEEPKKMDEEKENGANEVFGGYDNIGLELIDPMKNAEKQNFNKQHIDQLAVDGNKIYENEDNQQIEENEPEDDDPEYADHIAREKEPAVRN